VSQEKALVLAFEDLHWIDKTSEEFLGYLIGWLANTSILLILLYRPEYTHQWGSKSYYTKVGVDQLGTPSSTELVQSILEEGQVAPEIKQLILNRAAGNPLFMEEFTHALLENGSIERKDDKYVLSRKPDDIQVPDTIQGIIAARMDRLEDNLKRTMQVASVIGRDFAFRILQTITGMREDLKSYLLNLQGLELIYEKQLFPELEYIFKHIITQEVAYNSLLLKRRKEIHEKIGKAIEQIYADRLEEFYEMLAYHYSKGGNFKRAFHYLKLSGDKAAAKHSSREAFYSYKEALNSLKKLPESEEYKNAQIEVCLLAFVPAVMLSFPEDSIEIFKEGEKLAEEAGDERSLAHFNSFISIYYQTIGKFSFGLPYAEKGFHLAEKIQDIEIMAPTALDLCLSYDWTGQTAKTVDIIPRILDLLEEKDKKHAFFSRAVAIYPSLWVLYGFCTGELGNFEQGEVFCERGLQVAKEINDPRTLGLVEFYYSSLYIVRGDGKLALEHCQNSIKSELIHRLCR
jgi:predicted ATPase